MFKKIVIFGVGLIGGSFALGLRKANFVAEVVGFGRSEATLQQAQQLGIIHRIGHDIASEVCDADIVLLATPVGQMPDIMQRIVPYLGAHTLVTDGGSTKSDVVTAARTYFAEKISQFVPAHPIAGAEQSGAAAARADLYIGKKVVITPLPENTAANIARIEAAWACCGANIFRLSAAEHDRIFAAVSHLPHLLAFALVHDLAQRENCQQLLSYAASGFRDFTRIASSSPEMWRDICMANREALLGELNSYIMELQTMYQALQSSDAAQLEQAFGTAKIVRSNWKEQ